VTSLRQPKQLAKFSSFLIENGATIKELRERFGVSAWIVQKAIGKPYKSKVEPAISGEGPSENDLIRWNAASAMHARSMPLELGASSLVGGE